MSPRPLAAVTPTPAVRRAVGAVLVAVVVTAAMAVATLEGWLPLRVAAGVVVSLGSGVAFLAWAACRDAARRSAGVEARVWTDLSRGAGCWALGVVPYVAFLATGGDVRSPAAWSQIGFLAAYPFWYRAFWLLRQPVLAESRIGRLESWGIEAAAFGLIAAIVAAALWHETLPAGDNVALLIPVALDLLLLAALYNAMRRSSVNHSSALAWCAYAFGALAATDALVSHLVVSAHVLVLGLAMLGYWLALSLLVVAAERPMRVTEAQAVLGPSRTILAALALALCAPAGALAPAPLRPVVWAVAAFLLWRLVSMLRASDGRDTDPLTGLLESRPFTRHVGGVVQAATDDAPAVLVAVELEGFGAWNARNGYAAGDALLTEVAGRLENSALPAGVWSRMGADRFAWIGVSPGSGSGRTLGELAQASAAANSGALTARAAVVVLPADAGTASNALAAAEESLAAAGAADRAVVAFDRGRIDGIEHIGGYTASLAQRRAVVTEVLQAPGSIDTVLQPVVDLTSGEAIGFEALSRFRAEPMRPPDRWIAEAHAVGLGLQVEVECVRRAAARRHDRPEGTWISINASPAAILTPELEEALGEDRLDWLVVEITEHEVVADYGALAARLADLRHRGAAVAIDDTGAGHSSLRHVTQLCPDFIKLDRSLVQDAHLDARKVALLRSMKVLERHIDARLVAEGVESLEELETLRDIGVSLAQGYLFSRPAGTYVTQGLLSAVPAG